MDDFDSKDEKDIDEKDDFGVEPEDDLLIGSKKSKSVPADDLLSDDDESLEDLAAAELEEDEPYDDVDKW